jgi:cellulose biosynthesis protein BcsQ
MSRLSNSRYPAPRISIFNHKGGVGKTSLTFNIASALGSLGHKVLVVDADPQSNLTSIFIPDEVVDNLLDESDSPNGNTIWTALKPIVEASGDVHLIEPYEMANNLFLVPGDIKLAEYEEELPTLWGDCYQSKIKGYRGVSAISNLVNQIASQYEIDYIFYDSGPNIGTLNKVILLDCDFYVIPAACDIFSIRAIKTLGRTLHDWINNWGLLRQLAPAGMYVLPGKPVFIGYIPQRFKTYAGIMVNDFSNIIPKMERQIKSEIVNQISKIDKNLVYTRSTKMKLGEIKDLGPLATSSQQIGRAYWELPKVEQGRKEEIKKSFIAIAEKMKLRINRHRQ